MECEYCSENIGIFRAAGEIHRNFSLIGDSGYSDGRTHCSSTVWMLCLIRVNCLFFIYLLVQRQHLSACCCPFATVSSYEVCLFFCRQQKGIVCTVAFDKRASFDPGATCTIDDRVVRRNSLDDSKIQI
jgi:hypothetical protein